MSSSWKVVGHCHVWERGNKEYVGELLGPQPPFGTPLSVTDDDDDALMMMMGMSSYVWGPFGPGGALSNFKVYSRIDADDELMMLIGQVCKWRRLKSEDKMLQTRREKILEAKNKELRLKEKTKVKMETKISSVKKNLCLKLWDFIFPGYAWPWRDGGSRCQ